MDGRKTPTASKSDHVYVVKVDLNSRQFFSNAWSQIICPNRLLPFWDVFFFLVFWYDWCWMANGNMAKVLVGLLVEKRSQMSKWNFINGWTEFITDLVLLLYFMARRMLPESSFSIAWPAISIHFMRVAKWDWYDPIYMATSRGQDLSNDSCGSIQEPLFKTTEMSAETSKRPLINTIFLQTQQQSFTRVPTPQHTIADVFFFKLVGLSPCLSHA